MEGEYDYLQGQPEEPKPESDIENKMFLQTEVMKYAMRTSGISDEEWVEKYAEKFSELFDNSDVEKRFEEVQDENPESLYAWIQESLEKMVV